MIKARAIACGVERCMRAFALLFLVLSASVFALENQKVAFGPVPDWVDVVKTVPLTPTPEEDKAYGLDYLLVDKQVNLAEESTYYRRVYRVTNEGSLHPGSQIMAAFDPSYEELTLHHVKVIREGEELERLGKDELKVLQQEKELERALLNGRLTAMMHLDDIRVGDVIDVGFTRRGFNPVYKGLYFDSVYLGWGIPVRRDRFSVLVPEGRTIYHRVEGEDTVFFKQEKYDGGMRLYLDRLNLKPRIAEGEAPGWHVQWAFIKFSEMNSWEEVVTWALPFYTVPSPLPKPVRENAEKLVRGKESDEEKIEAILQFVQKEIRYLGLTLGTGSHKPNPPELVLSRRFGDCKDKSLLFCSLLKAVGIEAWPALVNCDSLRMVEKMQPSIHDFDHVIALVRTKDWREYWVDPTLSYQAGSMHHRGLPDYQRALVLKSGVQELREVKIPEDAQKKIRRIEDYVIPLAPYSGRESTGDNISKLNIVTQYHGIAADNIRYWLAQSSTEQIGQYYHNYVARTYPSVRQSKPVEWSDDQEKNSVEVREFYEIQDFWVKQDIAFKLSVGTRWMLDYTEKPSTPVRKAPLWVSYPENLELELRLHMAEPWNVENSDSTYRSSGFEAHEECRADGKEITIKYRLRNLQDFVAAEDVPAHCAELDKFRAGLGYELTCWDSTGGGEGAGRTLNWLLLLVWFLTLSLSTVGMLWFLREMRKGPPPIPGVYVVDIGGWLVVLGFAMAFSLMKRLISMVMILADSSSMEDWINHAIGDAPSSIPYYGGVVVFDVMMSAFLLMCSIMVLFLFFERRRRFRSMFTFYSLSVLGFYLVRLGAKQHWEVSGEEMMKEWVHVSLAMAGCIVWIPSIWISHRVKRTFLR